jgi:hypothetical protein
MINRYVECACYSPYHTLRFSADDETEEVYVDVWLLRPVWYKRIWIALRYVFGKPSRFGFFEETLLTKEQQEQVKDLLYV